MALAHAERDEVRGAYNSALYLSPRRRMLAEWAALVTNMIAREEVSSNRDAGALARARAGARGCS